MASAAQAAWLVTAVLLAANAYAAADDLSQSAYGALPAGYSLSFDKDKWTDEFSVFHLAVAEPFGVIGSGFAASDDPRLRPLTRLDSAWNLTSPLGGLPMRVGDGVSSANLWDQPARMGGVQIGSYQTPPPEVIAPPSLIASSYEVSGPVALTTTRFIDHLQSLIQFQRQSLTPAGQGDFSLESGRLRENFEIRSSDYGPWITSGSYRYGLSAATTVDGQIAEISGQQSFVGVGVLEGLGPLGLASAQVASSRDPDSTGWLARMGYDYTRDRLTIAFRSHIQSPGFQDVGDSSVVETFRQRTLASAGFDLGSLGKLAVASASQTYFDDSRRDLVAVSHAMPFGAGGIVSTAAAYSPGQSGNSAVLLSFTYPFDYIAGPARRLSRSTNSALDQTIVDAFGQLRIPAAGLRNGPVAGSTPGAP